MRRNTAIAIAPFGLRLTEFANKNARILWAMAHNGKDYEALTA
jgi:hypothetical protein